MTGDSGYTEEDLKTEGEKAAEAAAESLNRGRENAEEFLAGAAEKLRKARKYLKDPDAGFTLDDARAFARRFPGTAMVATGVLGFFVARALYRRS